MRSLYAPALNVLRSVKVARKFLSSVSGNTKSLNNANEYCLSDINEHMDHVSDAVCMAKDSLVHDLKRQGFALVDGFLGTKTCEMYRNEAESLLKRGYMDISQSTKWDNDSNSIITYDKHNVYSMQLLGGKLYETAPRLHEYVVSLIRALEPHVSDSFPEARLSSTLASNKLAVCLGDSSSYDRHFDSTGSDDLRKLTVLYYMNPNWTPELGGQFRIYHSESNGIGENRGSDDRGTVEGGVLDCTDIEPKGDRLLVFWSDRVEHSVLPSFAPKGAQDHRYALTVWIATDDASTIHMQCNVV